jgi:OmpA-OmpF porin, OOP family
MKITRAVLSLSVMCMFLPGQVAAQAPTTDRDSCADSPLISRYRGSTLIECRTVKYDDYIVATRRTTQNTLSASDGIAAPGKITSLVYLSPEGVTTADISANYRSALQRAGFEVLFDCATAAACGSLVSASGFPLQRYWAPLAIGPFYSATDGRYIAARLRRPAGNVYVVMLAVRSTGDARFEKRRAILTEVIEQQSVELGQVTVDAAALATGLTNDGKVALYGIYFDTDRADVLPTSRPQLTEISALLKSQPTLRLLVVGHTDGVGDPAYNQGLSQRRADAVVATLVRDFGIPAGRLTAVGVGMAAPVQTNSTDAGRARNRRVEIVGRLQP